jgi:hypothetical protein
MEIIYCRGCGKETGHKRSLGFGTFFAVIVTFGLWLIAIPFYPLRCIACGKETEKASVSKKVLVMGINLIIAFFIFMVVSNIIVLVWHNWRMK